MAHGETNNNSVTGLGVTRRSLLGSSAVAIAGAGSARLRQVTAAVEATPVASPAAGAPGGDADPQPLDVFETVLGALRDFPIVALGENHQLQDFHDVVTALLFRADLPDALTDIVVEFGNALYQDVADRFLLDNEPVANADLSLIWRNVPATLYDAPVYAQFFRSVRALNWMRPPERRIRVLLGLPPVDFGRVRSIADKDYALSFDNDYNAHMANVVEREVLQKGRRALIIAGGGHTLRGLRDSDQPDKLNTASILVQRHPGAYFGVDLLTFPGRWLPGDAAARLREAVARWPRPSIVLLAGTWLGSTPSYMAYRAVDDASALYAAQADAVIYLGPDDRLLMSLNDPAVYQCGGYADELRRLSPILGAIYGAGSDFDIAAAAQRQAEGSPRWIDHLSD